METLKKYQKSISFEESGIFKMSMGDRELFRDNLVLFVSETTSDLQDLEDLLQKKNRAGMAYLIHKLAGRIGQVGSPMLSVKLRSTEKELAENKSLNESEIQLLMQEIALLVKDTENYCADLFQTRA